LCVTATTAQPEKKEKEKEKEEVSPARTSTGKDPSPATPSPSLEKDEEVRSFLQSPRSSPSQLRVTYEVSEGEEERERNVSSL
jgi:hypothetical protein